MAQISGSFCFFFTEIVDDASTPPRREGRFARSSRYAGRGCGGRDCLGRRDHSCWRTRRMRTWSRVVLAFRC